METGSPGSGSATPTSARASPRSQRPRETGGSPRGERNYNFLPTTTRPSSYLAYSRGKKFRRTFTLRTCTKERTGNATALHSTLDKHGRGDGRMTAARTAERTDHPTSEGRPGPGPGMLASFRAEKSAEPGRVSSPGACANVGLAVAEPAKPAHVMISWGTANPRERRPRGEGRDKNL